MNTVKKLVGSITFRLKYLVDLWLWLLTVPTAFMLRLDVKWNEDIQTMLAYSLLSIPIKAIILYLFKTHRQRWRKIGLQDLTVLLQATGWGTLILFFTGIIIQPWTGVPRSIPLIDGLLALFTMGGIRFLFRLIHEQEASKMVAGKSKRVIIIGAGETGTMIAREMLRHPESGLKPLGFLDDDRAKQHDRFMGLPVLGTIDSLSKINKELGTDEVLIAMPSASGQTIRQVIDTARQTSISYRIMPALHHILSGKVSITHIRNVDLEDLLRREPVELKLDEIIHYLKGKTVLVTGAGGSIGSELVRQVANFYPARVILLDHNENNLYYLGRELEQTQPALDYHMMLANVQQQEKVNHIFSLYQPDVVFHTAAHKHVPMMESHPDQAVLNNIGGTQNLLNAALKHRVQRFVNISTDKAVRPTSIMGASKRISEYLVQQAASQVGPDHSFVSVRFGNVLGSQGSVIPVFKEQIARGGPITVTHPDMTRYFMTVSEAVQLVLQAGGLGENGVVYVLDMGEPVKIIDLVYDLIRLSGLEPNEDIPIVFTGIRPGEKLFEELLATENDIATSKYEKIFVERSSGFNGALEPHMENLFATANQGNSEEIRRLFKELIPTYSLNGTSTQETNPVSDPVQESSVS